ncbi:MAG: type II/IV secretion system protein [Gemmatimonadetes bacterium]|nr:type II/IV secretion system protein [Gemmatimonadota bacterium]
MGTSARAARDEWLLPTLEGLVTPEQFAALKSAREDSVWETAVRRGFTSDDQILTALASRFRMKIANINMISQQARELVPEQLVRKYRVLPLQISDSVLDIATADPHDLDCERTLAFALGRTIRMSLASPTKILERLDEVYRPENVIEKILENVAGDYDIETLSEQIEDSDLELGANRASERPVIQLVDRIVAEGIQSRASDIHLEPEEAGVAVRYRIDGVLRQVMILPKAAGIPLVSRVKIMAQLDIADRLRPQDGRSRVVVSGNRVDLRVSTLPASQGEKVVIRILDQRATVLSLDGLGLNPDELERIHGLLQAREGVVLVTGPTGSGKTTTLYSMLRTIQARGDAASSVTRLLDIGVESYKIAASLKGVVAQRLLRRLCVHCRELAVGQVPDRLRKWFPDGSTLYRPVGCSECSQTGYRGRLAITEVLTGSPELERRVAANESSERIADAAREGGMRGLWESGVQHARNGTTSLEELLRVLEAPAEPTAPHKPAAPTTRNTASVMPGESAAPPAPIVTDTAAPTIEADLLPPPPKGRVSTLHATPPASFTGDSFQLVDEEHANVGESKKVLLVEDEDALRRVVKDLLEREGFTVFEAADGVKALDEIDRAAPDIVVLDLNLPRLDGYGVLSHLRARPSTANLPVIVLTAKGDEDSEVRVFEYGASDYLTKPFRPRALSARLHSLLARGHNAT